MPHHPAGISHPPSWIHLAPFNINSESYKGVKYVGFEAPETSDLCHGRLTFAHLTYKTCNDEATVRNKV